MLYQDVTLDIEADALLRLRPKQVALLSMWPALWLVIFVRVVALKLARGFECC